MWFARFYMHCSDAHLMHSCACVHIKGTDFTKPPHSGICAMLVGNLINSSNQVIRGGLFELAQVIKQVSVGLALYDGYSLRGHLNACIHVCVCV